MLNGYSTQWFQSFVPGDDSERTNREIAFLLRQLPLAWFPRILDVCCGTGRHARKLAALGYQVTGLDRSRVALAEARRETGDGVQFLEGDMRSLDRVAGEFDAVICMWQSFGYFDDVENGRVLDTMSQKVRRGGRVILDVYDRMFVEQMPGRRRIDRGGEVINETVTLVDDRLSVGLEYVAQEFLESFDWRVYTADQLIDLARASGLEPVQVAADFRESVVPNGKYPRMQLVLERRLGRVRVKGSDECLRMYAMGSGISRSRHSYMRELRTQVKGWLLRILYAFDPRRIAILLVGGDKTGRDRWYEEFVPRADDLYDGHLRILREEGLL